MDFIKEFELYLENKPELYGQKLLIVKAMRNPEIKAEEIKSYFSNLIQAGRQMVCAEYDVDFELNAETLETLVDNSIQQTNLEIRAGQYDDLDSVFNVEESASIEVEEKKAKAAGPEAQETQEVSIEEFKDPEFLALALVKEFAKPEDANYAEILEEIEESLDYSDSYDWRGMADFTAEGTEFTVIRSDDQAELIAVDEVKNFLETEPESVGDWANEFYYISETDIRLISNEDADFLIDEMSDQEVVEQYGSELGFDEEDEESNDIDKLREDAKEKHSKEQAEFMKKDPVGYLEELGYDLGQNKPNFLSLDLDAAAEFAVRMDGWAHELSRYDGGYKETKEGLVYYRR